MPVPEGDITTSEILDTAIAEAITDIADQEYITIEEELAEIEEQE